MSRHYAVIGDPIAHSLSPLIHRVAFDTLGITDAHYDAIRVASADFELFTRHSLERLSGLSVTMPHKANAHRIASRHDSYGYLGIANTLVREGTGFAAFNTDVYGITRALQAQGVSGAGAAAVLGSGASALSLVVALRELGVTMFRLSARSRAKLEPMRRLLEDQGARVHLVRWGSATVLHDTDILASALAEPGARAWVETVSADATAPPAIFDVLYHPSPTPIEAWARARLGNPTGESGARMLAFQAARQVELMHGVSEAPAQIMLDALLSALRDGAASHAARET